MHQYDAIHDLSTLFVWLLSENVRRKIDDLNIFKKVLCTTKTSRTSFELISTLRYTQKHYFVIMVRKGCSTKYGFQLVKSDPAYLTIRKFLL